VFDLNRNIASHKVVKPSLTDFSNHNRNAEIINPVLSDKLMRMSGTPDLYPRIQMLPQHKEVSFYESAGDTPSVQMAPGDKHDLTSAGLADDPKLEKVFDAEAIVAIPHMGEHVRKIQQALLDLGIELPEYGADGIFGTETEQAVKDFQKKAGMSEIEWDGIVGRKTIGLLDKSLRNGIIEVDTDSSATDFTVFKPKKEDPSCKGKKQDKKCKQEFLTDIDKAVDQSVKIVDETKKKLPPTGTALTNTFTTLFRNNDTRKITSTAEDVKNNFDLTRTFIRSLKSNRDLIRCGTECDGGCRSGSPAYHSNLKKAPFHKITFCEDFQKHAEKLLIIIHECHHAAVPGSKDFAYPSERLIEMLDFTRALKNAASYHLYASMVINPAATRFGPKTDDTNLIKNSALKNKVDLVIAFIEHWFSLNTFDISTTITDAEEAKSRGAYDKKKHNNAIIFMERVFSKWFGLTKPPTTPNQIDIDKLRAIEERLTKMEKVFDKPFSINETSGASNWTNTPVTSILLNPATLALSQADLTMAMLQELVNSIPHISAELEPLYVGSINDLRNLRDLDP
jgi:peptidoglycan hydrolase-like protein with peptidoglycan-binding domain